MRVYENSFKRQLNINEDGNSNNNTIVKYGITRSKHGIPCLWEAGGSNTNTGGSTIIGNKYGEPKKPIYIREHGVLACDAHALIPIREGDVVINTKRYRGCIDIWHYRISKIEDNYAILEVDNSICWEMLQAAVDKAYAYHCRVPMYIETEVCKDEPVNIDNCDGTGNDGL